MCIQPCSSTRQLGTIREEVGEDDDDEEEEEIIHTKEKKEKKDTQTEDKGKEMRSIIKCNTVKVKAVRNGRRRR